MKINLDHKGIDKLEKYISKLEQENKQLKEEIKELNDNTIWWNNRFNAVERDKRKLKDNWNKLKEYCNYNDECLYTFEPDYDYEENLVDNYVASSFREDILDILKEVE